MRPDAWFLVVFAVVMFAVGVGIGYVLNRP